MKDEAKDEKDLSSAGAISDGERASLQAPGRGREKTRARQFFTSNSVPRNHGRRWVTDFGHLMSCCRQ
jgi:hypothetical protein